MNQNNIDFSILSNDELLDLYDKVVEHIKYLDSSIITIEDDNLSSEEDGGEDNGES